MAFLRGTWLCPPRGYSTGSLSLIESRTGRIRRVKEALKKHLQGKEKWKAPCIDFSTGKSGAKEGVAAERGHFEDWTGEE